MLLFTFRNGTAVIHVPSQSGFQCGKLARSQLFRRSRSDIFLLLPRLRRVIFNPKGSSKYVVSTNLKESEGDGRVAFLGLGIMGQFMATNLVKAGHEVTVWNPTPGKSWRGNPAPAAPTPLSAAQGAEAIWLCVSDTDAVEEVIFGKEGAESSLAQGAIIADSSTISPSATIRFAERVGQKGQRGWTRQ